MQTLLRDPLVVAGEATREMSRLLAARSSRALSRAAQTLPLRKCAISATGWLAVVS